MLVCYLCGNPIEKTQAASRDHRTPRVLLGGAPPKQKGFTFGGFLPTHEPCNNRFKGEANVPTALRLLELLHDDSAFFKLRHPDDQTIPILVIDAARFGDFTRRDLTYFKIADFSSDSDQKLPPPAAFNSMIKTDAKKASLDVILSVLAKSGAAHLIGTHGLALPDQWRIVALPFVGARQVNLEESFGHPTRFGPEVRLWVAQADNNYTLVYQSGDVCIAFVVGHDDPSAQIELLEGTLTAADCWIFQGTELNELVDYRWAREDPPAVSAQGRNGRCACGSGARFKHCCGRL